MVHKLSYSQHTLCTEVASESCYLWTLVWKHRRLWLALRCMVDAWNAGCSMQVRYSLDEHRHFGNMEGLHTACSARLKLETDAESSSALSRSLRETSVVALLYAGENRVAWAATSATSRAAAERRMLGRSIQGF